MINEALFQFIWKFSLYQPGELKTTAGESITVIHPGVDNRDSGPDFTDARIRIGNTLLAGNVELHVHSSDWKQHGHTMDAAYQNIILHVVYEDDEPENFQFPKLILSPHIRPEVPERYERFVHNTLPVPCATQLHRVSSITKESWLNRLLAERWEEKLAGWREQWLQASGDWRTLLYWRLAQNFGFKTNAEPFLQLAKSLPLNIIAKHKPALSQIEALLFGQAGMLEQPFQNDYARELQQEYNYLRGKYQLTPIPSHLWKFLRMRPANFPTVRIAQFAMLLHQSAQLFSDLLEITAPADVVALLQVTASPYWDQHFTLSDEPGAASKKRLGQSSIENIILNTIAPLQFFYAREQGNANLQDRAIQLLTVVSPEANKITDTYTSLGWKPDNGLQSQAMIQLFHQYCAPRKCLQCAIGLGILKSGPDK